MAKTESDVFIYKVRKDVYRAHPSPFVVHGAGTEIQFKNLTGEAVELDFAGLPVHGRKRTLPPGGDDSVFVDGDAKAGYYKYTAVVLVPAAAPGARRPGGRKAPPSKASRRVAVKGNSPPTVIIDV